MSSSRVHIYTDASFSDKTFRAAGAIYGTCDRTQTDLNMSFEIQNCDNNNYAEWMTLKKALEFAQELPRDIPITIYTDSQYALKRVHRQPRNITLQFVYSRSCRGNRIVDHASRRHMRKLS